MVPTVVGSIPAIMTDTLAGHGRRMQGQLYDTIALDMVDEQVAQRRDDSLAITAAVGAALPESPQPQQPLADAPVAVGTEELQPPDATDTEERDEVDYIEFVLRRTNLT